MTLNIGLIGVGLMGHGIASNLVRHGHTVCVLDHPGNQPLDALRAAGVASVDTAAAVAARSDLIILCVTGSPQVEAVVFGEHGLLQGLQPGAVVIDCSTAVPTSTEGVAAAVAQAGGRFLDAPMTRTAKEAAQGRLNLLVGGDADVLAACRPVLACFAENITHTGPVGAGHRMKLLHNFVSLGFAALLSEAAACARQAGVADDVFVEVLAKGGGAGVVLERLRPYIHGGDDGGLKFSLSNAQKDLSYYATMAGQAGAAHAIADAVLDSIEQGVQLQGGDAYVPRLLDALVPRDA